MVVTSVHSSAMMLKMCALWSRLSRDSSTHVQRAFTNSTTAFFEMYVAFPPALSGKVWSISPPQLTTNSTNLSKLVVCAICWWARKWVHRIRASIAFLGCHICCSPTFLSWLIMDPSFLALSAFTSNCQDKRCTSLWMWFHFLSCLLPVIECFGSPRPTSPLERSSTPSHNLQNDPCKSWLNYNHGNVSSTFCCISWFPDPDLEGGLELELEQCFFGRMGCPSISDSWPSSELLELKITDDTNIHFYYVISQFFYLNTTQYDDVRV